MKATELTDGKPISELVIEEQRVNDNFSRYITVRGSAQMVQNQAFDLQALHIPFPEEVWEGIIEALENVRTCLTALVPES